MAGFKGLFRKLHLFFGLLSGIVVFTVAITGAIYAFEEEFRSYFYSDLLNVQPEARAKKSPDEIVQAAKLQYPKPPIKNIRLKADSSSSAEIILKNKESVYINPYTGQILGSANRDTDFFGTVLKIHRTLYLGDTGKVITGTSATIFFFMLLSGIVLWWPGNKNNLRKKFSILKNASGKRLIYDLHSVFGFYASWIIIFTALTGIIWSFKWAENGLYRLTGSKKEDTRQIKSLVEPNVAVFSFAKIVSDAKALCPETADCFIQLPEDSTGAVKVNLQYEKNGFFRKSDQIFFDQYSGKLIKSRFFKNASTGDKIKSANYNIHTGKALGLVGQLLVFFAAIITASLPVTGFLMWRRRNK